MNPRPTHEKGMREGRNCIPADTHNLEYVGGVAIRDLMRASVHSRHNGYVDLYQGSGLIDLGMLICLLFSGDRRLRWDLRCSERIRGVQPSVSRCQRGRFAVLIAAILYNLSESTFARLGPI